MSRFLQATCLKPWYSLRYQLFVSFGFTSAIAIGAVVLVAVLTVRSSGESVKTEAGELLSSQVMDNARDSSEHTAETISEKFKTLEGVVSILGEVTMDRIVGYPNDGWESDEFVPFYDTMSKRNVYPFVADPLPPDWNIDVNVNESNHQEHVQERWSWYTTSHPLSTASATYRIQGACDPDETNPDVRTFYDNCTTANNDFATGGVVQPTGFNQYLAAKAADLAIFLKPLYEAHVDVKQLGIYFANSGAGSSLVYPSFHIDGRVSYVSEGCDWMRAVNPNTRQPFGTEQEIARCHPRGATVPGREYNPLERQWCRDQALNPTKVEIVGPYLDAFVDDLWLLSVGKAVFDRMTGHFIGCTLLDVSVTHIAKILENVQLVHDSADVALVRWDDGTVVYSNRWNSSSTMETIHMDELGFCDERIFPQLKSLVDFEKQWRASEVREKFRSYSYNKDGQLLAAFPIPNPPEEYDSNYRPDFIILQSSGGEIYNLVFQMESAIDEDVVQLYVVTIAIGIAGLSVVLLICAVVAAYLTTPLHWMMDVCKRIVRHSSETSDGVTIYVRHDERALARCTPKTEVTSIVSEFQSIIANFSGDCPASVASPDAHDVLNMLSGDEEFGLAYLVQLYEGPEMIDQWGLAESRRCLATSQEIGETIEPEDDAHEEESPCVGVINAESKCNISKELPPNQTALSSSSSTSTEIDVTGGEEVKNAVTTSQSELREFAKRVQLTSCSESTRKNWGHITNTATDDAGGGRFEIEARMPLSSALFWWIMGLIVMPLLMTMGIICATVTVNVTTVLPSWLTKEEAASVALEVEHVIVSAVSHTAIAQEVFVPPVADLHLLTRVAGWFIFNGVDLAASFTDINQGTEECKDFPNDLSSCGFFLDPDRASCDCRWDDPHEMTCETYPAWRNQQKSHYVCQAQDADPGTGNRDFSTFPLVDDSPRSTLWWNDTSAMPGYSNSSLLQGHETVFDRTRTSAALAAVFVPLYNYMLHGFRPKHIGTYIAWEADGMLAGYTGCDVSYVLCSHFQSTRENGASEINPRLCPLDKFGYDPRCRSWYDEGKRSNRLHLTAPYLFATNNEVANSVTFPLVDPSSGAHVGQTLIDFFPTEIAHAATVVDRHSGSGFVIIVTPESDALGGDTLAGPGYTLGSKTSPPVQNLVMPCDEPSSQNRHLFDTALVTNMKQGHSDETTFRRRAFTRNGETVICDDFKEETLFIAYRPVAIREYHPLSPDDVARGVNTSDIHMASLGYVVPTEVLSAPFTAIEDQLDDDISRSIRILISLITAIAAVVSIVLAMITISIVKPVMVLLEFVTLINEQRSVRDIPSMQGGSREVNQVYASLAKLHKIVRFSNMAFFSGRMDSARRLLQDAIALFRSAGDQKGISIASNNLGNTLLAIRNQQLCTKSCIQIDGDCVHHQAVEAYSGAISSSTDDYEKSLRTSDRSDRIAALAEQLANRHFNRGLFFLITAGDDCAEPGFVENGQQDLLRAAELDAQVRNLWVEARQVQKNSVRYFERLLRRANGLIGLIQKGKLDYGSWNVGEILEEAGSLLFVVWNVQSSPLFDSFTRTGRLQQLEAAAIQYASCCGTIMEAARISSRMLVEDEYIGELPFSAATSAILTWLKQIPASEDMRLTEQSLRRDLRTMLRSSRISSDAAIGTNVVLFHDLANHADCVAVLESFACKLAESCSNDDFVIMPSLGSSEGESFLSIKKKGDISKIEWTKGCKEQRIVDVNGSVRRAIHTVVETSDISLSENDTWVILTTDRSRWDSSNCLLSESHQYLLSEIAQLNKARPAAIHFAIVSMDATDSMAAICSDFSRVSRESVYIDLQEEGPGLLDEALVSVASLVIGGGKKAFAIPRGITMEKF